MNFSNWPDGLIVYQVYPRSFKDSNGDGIGDLQGIKSKLSYLHELGINAIWISPIYRSPMVDFGYDVADYRGIDPIFGTLEDYDQILEEAHKKEISVFMDFVPNHTSSHHPWFVESKSSRTNPKRNWYIWADPKPDGSVPNNWLSTFGGSAWELDKKTGQYYLHSFDKEQPDLNWRNPEVVEEMKSALRFWMDRGVDGFRVDVPEWMFKDTLLRDEPPNPSFQATGQDPYGSLIHIHTVGLPESLEMINEFIGVLEEYENKFMVTEIWSDMTVLLRLYTKIDRKYFTPFNFSFITLPWLSELHKNFVDEFDRGVGNLYLPNYVLGSHDKSRVATRIGPEQARIGAMLTLTLRGIPFIYYGEEIGMTDTPIPPEMVQDPLEKKTPGLKLGRDPERTPMQWNRGPNAGFTTGKPWLPINENYLSVNVEDEMNDPKSTLNFYKTLINFRKRSKAITYGNYSSWDAGNKNVFCYTRQHEKENVLVILNYSNESQNIKVPFEVGKLICSTYMDRHEETIYFENMSLRPNEGLLLELQTS